MNQFNPTLGLMLSLLVSLLLVASNLIHAQNLEIQVGFSKHNSVLIFLEQLASNSDNDLKSIYEKSIFNVDNNKLLIQKFKELDLYFSHGGFKSTRQFKSICIKNDSWAEIRNQSIGLFPDRKLSKLIRILQHFEPIYHSLIYTPSKKAFNKQLKVIDQLIKKKNLEKLFYQSMKFYGSTWDPEIPLIITFYPIPNAEGFKAKAYGNTITSGVPTDLNDFNILLSVLIHEACHLLYYGRTDAIDDLMTSTFESNPSTTATYAYWLFDEAAATTIGNGLIYRQLSGKLDEKSWYYHKYIDQMAKSILPLIEIYFKEQKTIDQQFVKEYIHIYKENFSSWLGELPNLMTYSSIIASNKNTIEYLQSKFRYSSVIDTKYPITTETLKKWSQDKITKVLLITERNNETLQDVLDTFPEITVEFDPDKDFIFNGLLADKTQIIVINAKSKSINHLIDELVLIDDIGVDFKIRYIIP